MNFYSNFILIFLTLFFSCKGENKNNYRTSEKKNVVVEDDISNSEKIIIEKNDATAEASGSVNAVDVESGISIFAPTGFIQSNMTPNISISALRKDFKEFLPKNAVVLGESVSVEVKNENGDYTDEKFFANNYAIKIPFEPSQINSLSNVGVLTRNIEDGNEKVRVITPEQVEIIHDQSQKSQIVFKAGSPSSDYQLIEFDSSNLTHGDVFIARPIEVQGLSCSPGDAYSITASWGMAAGTVAAYKIVFDRDEKKINDDIGCNLDSSIPNLTGTTLSYTISELQPETTYYMRVCSMNNLFPKPNYSPGKVCEVTTPRPDIPILQLVFAQNLYNIFYSKNSSGGDWNGVVEKIGETYTSAYLDKIFFETNFKTGDAYVAWKQYDGSTGYYLTSKKTTWQTNFIEIGYDTLLMKDITIHYNTGDVNFKLERDNRYHYEAHLKNSSFTLVDTDNRPFLNYDIFTIPPYGTYLTREDGERILTGFEHSGGGAYRIVSTKTIDGLWIDHAENPSQNLVIPTPTCNPVTTTLHSQLDQNQKLHLAYICQNSLGKQALFYATNRSGDFTYKQIDEVETYFAIGAFEMVLDEEGNAYFVYLKGGDGSTNQTSDNTIYIAKHHVSDNNLVLESIPAFIEGRSINSIGIKKINIAVDKNQKIHVVYPISSFTETSQALETKVIYLTNISGEFKKSYIVENSCEWVSNNCGSYDVIGLRINNMPRY